MVILALCRLRQKDSELEISLGSTVSSRLAKVTYGDLVSDKQTNQGLGKAVLATPTHTKVRESEGQRHLLFIASWRLLWDQ